MREKYALRRPGRPSRVADREKVVGLDREEIFLEAIGFFLEISFSELAQRVQRKRVFFGFEREMHRFGADHHDFIEGTETNELLKLRFVFDNRDLGGRIRENMLNVFSRVLTACKSP